MTEHLNEMIDVVNAAEVDEILKAVKSLISDIESMQQDDPNWFGGFSEFTDGGSLTVMHVEWPNLAISLAALKKLIEPQTIEGELTEHHQKALGHDGGY
jgi:hypothetical protein